MSGISSKEADVSKLLVAKILWTTVGALFGMILVADFELITGTTGRAVITLVCLSICWIVILIHLGWLYLVNCYTNIVVEIISGISAGIAAGPVFGLISGVIFGLLFYSGPPSYLVPITFAPILMVYYAIIGLFVGSIGGIIFWLVPKIYNHPIGWALAGMAIMFYFGLVPFTLFPRAKIALCRPDCAEKSFVWVNLSGANLNGVNLTRTNFYRANLKKADLRNTDLSGANFRSADFTKANLYGANLNGTETRMSDMSGAILPDGTTRK